MVESLNTSQEICDLSEIWCLTPGRRAGRQLLHLLVERCNKGDLFLLPPRFLTPGDLVTSVTSGSTPIASPQERSFAWIGALRGQPPDSIEPLLPFPPDGDDAFAWHDLARTLMRLHDELAGQRLTFGDVVEEADRQETLFAETQRWRVIESIHRSYLAGLEDAGRIDPHLAFEQSLSRGLESDASIRALVMVGVIELNAVQQAIIRSMAQPTHALIHAPEALADHFDEWGGLIIESWTSRPIDLDDEQIRICDRPADQAQATLRSIADIGARYKASEITIGLGDEALTPQLLRDGEWTGLSLHAASGIELNRTPPCRLLKAIGAWLADRRFTNFAQLVRHSDLELWLQTQLMAESSAQHGVAKWLTLLDEYFNEHLHERLEGDWLGDAGTQRDLKAVYQAVQTLLSPLSGARRKLSQWSDDILAVLRTVYEALERQVRVDPNAVTIDACVLLRDLLERWRHLADDLQPTVNADEAIGLLLLEAADQRIAMEAEPDQIDMLGWLELHLDTAPILLITGVNDSRIPHAVSGDAFLPDALRRKLGLMHNQRRLARDAYLMQAIVKSREHLTLMTGRRSSDGEPLTPSRLLMACDDKTVCRRIEVFCREPENVVSPLPIGAPKPSETSAFTVPPLPDDLEPPGTMSVTDFKRYLECPYRYALARLFKLKSRTDDEVELDAARFGSLTHDVLERFGSNEDVRDAVDEEAIKAFLHEAMKDLATETFGPSPLPAVRVQLARLEQRLSGFARCQANLRREGWSIRHCELKFTDENALTIPDQAPMPIVGKIDRIDRHDDGRWRIIDYKTGDVAGSPNLAHLGHRRVRPDDELVWQDLQLPLYRHLAGRHGVTGDVELGYLVLPKHIEGVKFIPAEWTASQIEAALETARDVVRRIRSGDFRLNKDHHSPYDVFDRICQTTAFTVTDAEPTESTEAAS